jgi:3alpha(or 20beta)-hydroxysteroid dehydrogenase
MAKLDGCVALVTGAARGQGAAHVRDLAARGATVVATDVLDESGTEGRECT